MDPPGLERGTLFRSGVVAVAEHAAVEDGVGIAREDQFGKLPHPPLLLRALPFAVEPEDVGAEAGDELADLAVAVREVARPGLRVLLAGLGVRVGVGLHEVRSRVPLARVVRVVPVGVRVVEADFEVPRAQRVDESGDEIAACRCVPDDVEIAVVRIPQGDAVVVPGGEHRVLRADAGEQLGPGVRVVARRGEAVELFHVLLVRHLAGVEGPGLGRSAHGVDAVVDEDAQLGVGKPGLHRHTPTLCATPRTARGRRSPLLVRFHHARGLGSTIRKCRYARTSERVREPRARGERCPGWPRTPLRRDVPWRYPRTTAPPRRPSGR